MIMQKAKTKEPRAIQQHEVVEVCPECGAENVMTWDLAAMILGIFKFKGGVV